MNQEKPRPADKYMKKISKALEGRNYFIDRIDLFYNGDWQALFVNANEKGLSLIKQDNSDDIKYIMVKNKFSILNESVEDVIYDFIRFLNYKQLKNILNFNTDKLSTRHFQVISPDNDRGYLPCVVYRNGKNDNFHIVIPDSDNIIYLKSKVLRSLLDIAKYTNQAKFAKYYRDFITII